MIPTIVNIPQAPLGHPRMLRLDVIDFKSGCALLAMYLTPCCVLFLVLLGTFVKSPVTLFNIIFSIQVVTFWCPLLGASVFFNIFHVSTYCLDFC